MQVDQDPSLKSEPNEGNKVARGNEEIKAIVSTKRETEDGKEKEREKMKRPSINVGRA